MANKRITQLTEVTSVPSNCVLHIAATSGSDYKIVYQNFTYSVLGGRQIGTNLVSAITTNNGYQTMSNKRLDYPVINGSSVNATGASIDVAAGWAQNNTINDLNLGSPTCSYGTFNTPTIYNGLISGSGFSDGTITNCYMDQSTIASPTITTPIMNSTITTSVTSQDLNVIAGIYNSGVTKADLLNTRYSTGFFQDQIDIITELYTITWYDYIANNSSSTYTIQGDDILVNTGYSTGSYHINANTFVVAKVYQIDASITTPDNSFNYNFERSDTGPTPHVDKVSLQNLPTGFDVQIVYQFTLQPIS